MSQQNKKMRLQPEQDPLFDHVIFCTNATYAEGSSKAGQFSPSCYMESMSLTD
jgi:hypothetical protein